MRQIQLSLCLFILCGFLVASCNSSGKLVAAKKIEAPGKQSSLRKAVVSKARTLIGKPYHRAGTSPKKGFDCSGLVYHIGTKLSIPFPRTSAAQGAAGKVIRQSSCHPGDLIFFGSSKRINHVGIVTKNDRSGLWVVHSTSSRGVIEEDVLKSDYWSRRIVKVNRLDSYLPVNSMVRRR